MPLVEFLHSTSEKCHFLSILPQFIQNSDDMQKILPTACLARKNLRDMMEIIHIYNFM